jgi:metal-responsive CopG/Arc/MetJ family transcriptional regulator
VKTIAITIDEPTLQAIDRIASGATRGRTRARSAGAPPNRSKLIRTALQEFVARHERETREASERAVLARHKDRLAKQAAALVADQAEP